jgi:putative NAD(P)-binding protein
MSVAPSLSRFAKRTVLLVGSGPLAAVTLRCLIDADAHVRWFSQDIDIAEEIWLTARPHQLEISFREPCDLDFADAAAAFAVIGEPWATRIARQAQASGCPVSVAGRPDLTLGFDADGPPCAGGAGKAGKPRGSLLQRVRALLSHHATRELAATATSRHVRPEFR